MNEEKKFANTSELENWLKERGVDEEKAAKVVDKLYREGYDMPSTLIGSTVEELAKTIISIPIARHLSNKLAKQLVQQQQQHRPEEAFDAFEQRQQEQQVAPVQTGWPLPRSPAPVGRRQVSPPSEGKNPPNRPETGSLKTPSSEDGQKKALNYVSPDDKQKLYCSANSMAMEVVSLLDAARKENTVMDPKYTNAANFIWKVRENLRRKHLGDEEVNQNERLYTGAFCDGLNAVLDSGISVLHQGCIGQGATHSDLSARYVLDGLSSPTLMVGEGKADESDMIRQIARGQLFNELIRHRRIDSKLRKPSEHEDFRPILLLALNFNYISLDLAFPSTKGGHMENSEWVTFCADLPEDTETFWTISVAMVNIARANGQKNLPYVLRFIADTLQYIQNLGIMPREQFKTPWKTKPASELTGGEKVGDNVTIIESSSGKHVYKEFCYYLREDDGFNDPETRIRKEDQRWPPSPQLLEALGEPYSSWKIEDGPFGIKILEYDYIEGESWPTSQAWLQVLEQVKIMHSLGYVHGDLLPRNLIFSEDGGHVIDFDLMRKEGEPYVLGYNHLDFSSYRHPSAKAGEEMKKTHDVHALAKIGIEYFGTDDNDLASQYNARSITSIGDLKKFFESSALEPSHAPKPADSLDASGSPYRD